MVLVFLIGVAPLALTIVGALVAGGLERRRERRRHERIVAELGPSAEGLGAAPRTVVTLEGTLTARGDDIDRARLVSFHPYGTSFLDEVNLYAVSCSSAAVGFAVELDEGKGRALLEGPTQVLRGAVETEHTLQLEKAPEVDPAAEPLVRAKARQRTGQFRILQTGDRVLVRGVIEPAPDDDALYRERSNVVRMTPAPVEGSLGEPTIVIAATSSRQRRISRSPVLPGVVIGAIVGGVVAALAVSANLSAREVPAPAVAGSADRRPAPPPCREKVLASLTRYISDARGCDDAYARANALYAAGEFAGASKAFTEAALADPTLAPTLAEAETHLFVHQFGQAAQTVRRMNTQFYPGPTTAEKRHLECILDVLEARAKGPAPDDGPRFVKPCSLRPFAKVARELDSNGHYGGDDDWPRATYRQEARYDAVGDPYTSIITPRSRLLARPVALERDLLDRMVVGPGPVSNKVERLFPIEADNLNPILATWAAELTLFYAYAGFPERAAPYWPFLDFVAGLLEKGNSFHTPFDQSENETKRLDDERTHLAFVMAVAGAAAHWANDAARMKRYTHLSEPYTAEATRQMAKITQPKSTWEDPVVDRAWPEHKAIFDAALRDDAAGVARLLIEQRSTGRNTLPRALPQLGPDREPLETWFASYGYPAACPSCGASTFLGDLSDRREIARLLGIKSEQDRLRASAERFTTALTDPAIGFELDELETFFSKRK